MSKMRLAHQLVTFSSKLLLRSFYTAHKAHDEAAKSSSAGHLVHSSYHTLDIEACMHDTCYSLSLFALSPVLLPLRIIQVQLPLAQHCQDPLAPAHCNNLCRAIANQQPSLSRSPTL